MTQKQITKIDIDKLLPHPENPNRMSQKNFNKLIANISRSQNYEPIIVRKHPETTGCYQIINGHHRVKALKNLNLQACDCIIWDIDDDQARLLLATLNRLTGSDTLLAKQKLFKKLAQNYSLEKLAKITPAAKNQIQALLDMPKPQLPNHDVFCQAKPTVFFLLEDQQKILDRALTKAADHLETHTTKPQKLAAALIVIAEQYLKSNQ